MLWPHLVVHRALVRSNRTSAQQHKVFMTQKKQKQLPTNFFFSFCSLARLPSPLLSPATAPPASIHPHSSTSNINMAFIFSSLLDSVCYSVSFPFYCTLYLSVSLPLHLLFSLSNWFAISRSSDIAVTCSLSASYTELWQCCLAVSPPYISFKCVRACPSQLYT